MAVIHILDKHTAELIAAGEVVERPASVVKELLENSIDAGATKVAVTIERGGVSLIQVADNGSGIEAEYISTAFIRHATSKIQTQEDLESIHTLGFRGEALASIASVARVEVLTRTEPDEFACCYRIEGGDELGMEPGARPIGTTISVRDLFYNTPARMKFLKKDSSEGTFVGETVSRIALSHPEVSVSFVREGKLLYKTPGDGDLRSAVYAVLGKEFARDLLAVKSSMGNYSVSGLITPPRACRASRGMQFFFINGRFVKNRTMMAAMENAYRGTLMQGKFPGCVLMLDMPAQLVDVNVHPAKTEVRFARENDVFDAVYGAVKNALGQPGSGEQQFQFAAGQSPEKEPVKQSAAQPEATKKIFNFAVKQDDFTVKMEPKKAEISGIWPVLPKKEEPLEPIVTVPDEEDAPRLSRVWQNSQSSFAKPVGEGFHSEPVPLAKYSEPEELKEEPAGQWGAAAVQPVPRPEPAKPEESAEQTAFTQPAAESQEPRQQTMEPEQTSQSLQYVGEVFKTYIITQRGQEMCLIDKHAAHERILYERLAADYGKVSSQLLLAPVTVNLSAEEKNAILEHEVLLRDAGVETEDFGGSTVLVRSVPADVETPDVEDLICELAAKLARGSRDALSEKTEWVLHSIACRAAIKAGDRTASAELMHLAQDILDGKVPPFCPHGRPVVLKLTKKELEKQFGRIG
ncbi:DNA mismatch repair endonuclease MutL [Gemmiger sp. An194]|uniref:DNA mismatch repair endonuclease MutL n=1 Tax=Gemmiger sp. An194 TaxID=1965582 RepID=UPI000B3ACFDE|nr:DNA mismatch repair endonuclease MutL [Gemmiger sp. An194]OUP25072.1 DNA mismatch repair protein MutL [Gemmiger sp. An194]